MFITRVKVLISILKLTSRFNCIDACEQLGAYRINLSSRKLEVSHGITKPQVFLSTFAVNSVLNPLLPYTKPQQSTTTAVKVNS